MPMLAELVDVVIGVDTHTDTHTAAVVATATGTLIETQLSATDPAGYEALLEAARAHSGLRAWAIEGAGGYGAGLARHLAAAGEVVIELDRPMRPTRRGGRKSDPLDAERAARDALARTQLAAPKTGAARGALAMLLAARRSAVEAAGDAGRQLRALVLTAPEPVRAHFRGTNSTRTYLRIATELPTSDLTTSDLTTSDLTTSSDPDGDPDGDPGSDIEIATAVTVLAALAHRVRTLETEAAAHEKTIRAIVAGWRPDLLELPGLGPITAATVLTAWSHPGRCRNEAAFAMLAGAAPIPASSGRTVRYRLNRSGDRQLNRALHTIALSRQRHHQPTRDYTDRRRHEGKTDREIRRSLKRYIARQLYRQLEHSALDQP